MCALFLGGGACLHLGSLTKQFDVFFEVSAAVVLTCVQRSSCFQKIPQPRNTRVQHAPLWSFYYLNSHLLGLICLKRANSTSVRDVIAFYLFSFNC